MRPPVIKRLFLLAFILSLPQGFLSSYVRLLPMRLHEAGLTPIEIGGQLALASLALSATKAIGTLGLAILVYAFYEAINLRDEYIGVLASLFGAAFMGSLVAQLLGILLVIGRVEAELLLVYACSSMPLSLDLAIGMTLWGFAAAAISYLRRAK